MSFGVHDENLELKGQETDTVVNDFPEDHCPVIETSLIGSKKVT
jgi:hypothetical protein